jgi:hypothetical protein
MKNQLLLLSAVCLFASCVAPRAVINSGKVTPKGNFAIGGSMYGNIATAPVRQLADVTTLDLDTINAIIDSPDTLTVAQKDELNSAMGIIGRSAIAYALDPIGYGQDFFIRYGVAKRFDIGFKLAGSSKVFDIQYQFMGPTNTFKEITAERWYGSIAVQYSWANLSIPTVLSPVANQLSFDFQRKDVLVPLIFSRSFGNEEEVGSLSMGLAMNYTRLNYYSAPQNIQEFYDPQTGNVSPIALKGIQRKQNVFAYGGFIHCKIGYRYAYLIPGFAIYYQDYGNFPNIIGDDFHLSGWTFVPSIGLNIRLGKTPKS